MGRRGEVRQKKKGSEQNRQIVFTVFSMSISLCQYNKSILQVKIHTVKKMAAVESNIYSSTVQMYKSEVFDDVNSSSTPG